jgi:DNA-binding NtrC family response regulator
MGASPHLRATPDDDRSPYAVAEAVVATIDRMVPDLDGADAVWDAFAEWLGDESRELIDAIRRSRHSLFATQLQQLYAFGQERLGVEQGPQLCRLAGLEFTGRIFAENLHPLLALAGAAPGAMTDVAVDVVQAYLARYAGDTYVITTDRSTDGIECELRYRHAESWRERDASRGLDPERCFRNSAEFICGAVEAFVERAMERFDRAAFRLEVDTAAATARFHVPLAGDTRFAYADVLAELVAHVSHVTAQQQQLAAVEQREQDLILGSPVMASTWDRIRRAARSRELVLLRGESGTGKSFIARKIHGLSERAGGPFVEVALTSDVGSDNMVQSDLFGHERGAFTGAANRKPGLFALAEGGTIFLDEIGDATPEVQAKLLRVIESGAFRRLGGTEDLQADVRIVAATNRDLEAMVAEGTFRQDLYYRINVISVHIPPLRERPGDIPPLAEHLLERAARGGGMKRLAPGLGEQLAAYGWPGNVRELDHALKYAAAMGEGAAIEPRDLPDVVQAGLGAVGGAPAPAVAAGGTIAVEPPAAERRIVDVPALRDAIRCCDIGALADDAASHEVRAHLDSAKRVWLATLIDELGGDLQRIGALWDRGSDKTLRKLIKEFGLTDQLALARARQKS